MTRTVSRLLPLVFLAAATGVAGDLSIQFPSRPKICGGLKNLPYVNSFPNQSGQDPIAAKANIVRATTQQEYVRDLFNDVYPELVKLYGPPNTPGGKALVVSVYHTDTNNSHMYLTGSVSVPKDVLVPVIASMLSPVGLFDIVVAALATPCLVTSDIPFHSIFLGISPTLGAGADNRVFDHLFTHELIHAFHDRMDLLGWYTHSWIEEGMTEAAAELLAESLARQGGRDLRIGGLNGSPWDNLIHYDMWNYPGNGAQTGVLFPSEFSILGGIQFYFGGVPAFPTSGDWPWKDKLRRVIDTEVRYGAAAAFWLLLTKAASPDPANPDFLKRLNAQFLADNLTKADGRDKAYKNILEAIQKVAGAAMLDGLPVVDWIRTQALYKGATSSDYLLIHVRNPQNVDLPSKPVIIYGVYKETTKDDFFNSLNPFSYVLGETGVGELPAANCPLVVDVYDSSNRRVFRDANGKTDSDGRYVPDFVGAPPLPPGGYTIHVTAGICDRVSEAVGSSHVPAGMVAATFAMVSTSIHPSDVLFGVTGVPLHPVFGDYSSARPVSVQAEATIQPSGRELFTLDSPGAFQTFVGSDDTQMPVVAVGQKTPGGPKNVATFSKPNPFTRAVWLGVSSDYSAVIEPSTATLQPGGNITATVKLIPNGVIRGVAPAYGCPVSLFKVPATTPDGVTAELVGPNSVGSFLNLEANAPGSTDVPFEVRVGANVAPGAHDIALHSWGSGGCAGLFRDITFRLVIGPPPPPPVVNVSAMVNSSDSGFTPDRGGAWSTILTVTSTSQPARREDRSVGIAPPIQVVLTNLSPNATLVNKTGVFNGSPYITVTSNSLAPGQSASVTLVFTNSTGGAITYTPVIYSGVF